LARHFDYPSRPNCQRNGFGSAREIFPCPAGDDTPRCCEWLNSESALTKADAVVVSREDLNGDEEQIEHIAHHTKLLAVTEGAAGCVLYWHGDRRRFRALEVQEVDPTGAGDIFAAAFFFRLLKTRDPWEAARFATILASYSVTRDGLDGIPTMREIEESMMEVLD
jgi:sugar/nucleoside kinase (ribokinase family)